MNNKRTFSLSVLSLALATSVTAAQAQGDNELIQTEVARPAPPGQVRDRDGPEIPEHAQGNPGGMQGPSSSVIVRFRPEKDPEALSKVRGNPSERGALMQIRAQELSNRAGADVSFRRSMGLPHTHVFDINRHTRRDKRVIFDAILSDPSVEFVEENILHTPQSARAEIARHTRGMKRVDHDDFANDAESVDPNSQQWSLYESVGGINVNDAWDQDVSGSGTVVAVLDTGYRPHADLAANLLPGYDMVSDPWMANDGDGRDNDARDPGDYAAAGECGPGAPARSSSWHGTHVAGTIAAYAASAQGVDGVAYNANILPVRVLGRCGGTTADIADGILWASGANVPGVPGNPNPADVINLSLGGPGSCQSTTQQAINSARGNGATVVVAAGNSGSDAGSFTPASCSGVVTVAATDRDGGRAYYSNYGSAVTLAAPGGAMSFAGDAEGVLSTFNSGSTTPGSDSYAFNQGTSMAAPHVSGVAALIKEARPGATPDEVAQLLVGTVRSFPASCNGCGTGIVDAGEAVASALDDSSGGQPGGGGSADDLSAATGQWNRFTINVPAGMSRFEVRISGGGGDADLYVRHGASPTMQEWDCRPYLYGNDELCTIDNPASGTWYLGVHAYQAYSGVRLDAHYFQ